MNTYDIMKEKRGKGGGGSKSINTKLQVTKSQKVHLVHTVVISAE